MKFSYKDEITKRYKWAMENPNILAVSALQDAWIAFVEKEVLPSWKADIAGAKPGRAIVKIVSPSKKLLKVLAKAGR